jgi:hypothetical protein
MVFEMSAEIEDISQHRMQNYSCHEMKLSICDIEIPSSLGRDFNSSFGFALLFFGIDMRYIHWLLN